MRKLLLILFLAPLIVFGQVWQQNNLEYGHQFKGLKALRALLFPLAETTAGQGRDTGAVYYRLADSSVYVWTGSQWRQVAGGGDGTVTSFAFTNSTGITGTVLNATTTPTLSLVVNKSLQNVTDVGNLTTNQLISTNGLSVYNAALTKELGYVKNSSNNNLEIYSENFAGTQSMTLVHNSLAFYNNSNSFGQLIKPYPTITSTVDFTLPNTASNRYIPVSVNGNFANSSGNITVSAVDSIRVSSDTLKEYKSGIVTNVATLVPYTFSSLEEGDILIYNESTGQINNHSITRRDSSWYKAVVWDSINKRMYYTDVITSTTDSIQNVASGLPSTGNIALRQSDSSLLYKVNGLWYKLAGTLISDTSGVPEDLAAHYDLDESSGNYIGSIGTEPELTVTGTITQGATGKVGNATEFNSASAYVEGTNGSVYSPTGTGFAISFWVYITTDATQTVISKLAAGNTQLEYACYYEAGGNQMAWQMSTNGTSWSAPLTIPLSLNTWTFITCQYNSSTNAYSIQKDDGTTGASGFLGAAAFTGTGTMRLGADFSSGGTGLISNSKVDELSFWTTPFTAGRRTALYNSGSGAAYPWGL